MQLPPLLSLLLLLNCSICTSSTHTNNNGKHGREIYRETKEGWGAREISYNYPLNDRIEIETDTSWLHLCHPNHIGPCGILPTSLSRSAPGEKANLAGASNHLANQESHIIWPTTLTNTKVWSMRARLSHKFQQFNTFPPPWYQETTHIPQWKAIKEKSWIMEESIIL